jgi:hypothetical protein
VWLGSVLRRETPSFLREHWPRGFALREIGERVNCSV